MNSIREIWESSLEKFEGLPAVRWLNKKEVCERTYGELGRDIVKIRKGLKAEGFSGAHIALIGASSVWWISAYLGITTGQNTAVPLDAGLPDEDLIDLINRSDSEALFLGDKQAALKEEIIVECPKVRRIWMLSDLEGLMEAGGDTDDVKGRGEDEISTIIYTSGTTGKSKGVMLTQGNLAHNVESVEYTVDPGAVLLSVLPIHHAFCLVMDWLKGFSLGAVVCVNDSYMHMVRNMGIFKPDVMLMVPLMIETIYKKLSATSPLIPKKMVANKAFGGKLQIIFTGGAHLDPFYIEKFKEYGIDVLEGYGMSECSPVISSNTPQDHRPGSIGRPLKNVELKFENGEILVRGSSVMKGYYRMPDETAEALKDGGLHTGDKGYIDEDGFLFINGRVKNLIIMSNGENISPEEIENKLSLDPLVAEVIVTGENNGLVARIYPDEEALKAKRIKEDKVRDALQAVIDAYNRVQPSYRQVTKLIVRDEPFPRNATGKIKRQEAAA